MPGGATAGINTAEVLLVSKNRLAHISFRNKPDKIRVGFVPLMDSAPLIMAHRLGYFEQLGLNVHLSREIGWATVREKIIYGELEASVAVVGLPFAATWGIGCVATPCVTGFVLNANSVGICLSNQLYQEGVRDVNSLKIFIHQKKSACTVTLGIVSAFSSQNFLLRQWLRSGGINPDRDVRIVIVPPAQVVSNLKAGHLDGFCASEPWSSVAVQARVGWIACTSLDLLPSHADKVLMVSERFALEHEEQHLALIAALMKGCAYCENRIHVDEVARVLAGPRYFNLPTKALRPSLTGEFDFGQGRIETLDGLVRFQGVNAPSPSVANWVADQFTINSLCKGGRNRDSIFRSDIYQQALEVHGRELQIAKPALTN